jgi:hypothetical protein
MQYDFNKLEIAARSHLEEGRTEEALAIYFWMADGDPSLDGGYLAERIATCYEVKSEKFAAKFWLGRAIEENPEVYSQCRERIAQLGDLAIDPFLT